MLCQIEDEEEDEDEDEDEEGRNEEELVGLEYETGRLDDNEEEG